VLDAPGVASAEPLAAPSAAASDLREHRRDRIAAIADGSLGVHLLLSDDDPRTAQVKVLSFAEAVPGVGKVVSRRLLAAMGIADGTRWGELTGPTAERVVDALAEAARAGGA
jgi:hypothetical protein